MSEFIRYTKCDPISGYLQLNPMNVTTNKCAGKNQVENKMHIL